MSKLVEALKAEQEELDASLRKDPRYLRLRMIRALLAEYEPGEAASPTPLAPPVSPGVNGHKGPMKSPATKEAKILAAVESFLQHGAAHRSAILDQLIGKGLMGHEKRPIKALAIYLSKAENLSNDGKGNWFLKPQGG